MPHPSFYKSLTSWCLLVCFFCAWNASPLGASPDYWPTNGWRASTPEAQGMDSGKLIEMIEAVRQEGYALDNITVIRNGYVVMDAYRNPFPKDTKHVVHSIE